MLWCKCGFTCAHGNFPHKRYTKCPPNHWQSCLFTNLTQYGRGNTYNTKVSPGVSDVLSSKRAPSVSLEAYSHLDRTGGSTQQCQRPLSSELPLSPYTFNSSPSPFCHLVWNMVWNMGCKPGSQVRNPFQSVLEVSRRKISVYLPYFSFPKPMKTSHVDDCEEFR